MQKREVYIFQHPADRPLASGLTSRHLSGFLLYRASHSRPPAPSIPAPAGQPTPPAAILFIPAAAILFIPAPQSPASQPPSFRLGRPTPYTSPTSTSNLIIPTFFFPFLSPTFSRLPLFFHFSIFNLSLQPPPGLLSPRHSLPTSCCRLPNPQTKREM